MNILSNKVLIPAALVMAVATLLFAFGATAQASDANHGTIKCTITTIAPATVGNQVSSTVLAASSNRAYARIQQVRDASGAATSTVSLAFNDGSAATVSTGLQLSTTSPFIEFGLDTDFPYVGAVTGITNTGSTTVQVTACNY